MTFDELLAEYDETVQAIARRAQPRACGMSSRGASRMLTPPNCARSSRPLLAPWPDPPATTDFPHLCGLINSFRLT